MSRFTQYRTVAPRIMLATLAAGVVLTGAEARAEETITARGRVTCFASGAPSQGLGGVQVELMDSDCLGSQLCDDLMQVSRTDDEGNYELTGSGGDPFGGRPDVYVRFVYDSGTGVRLTDEVNATRSTSTPEHDHDNASGAIDFGEFNAGAGAGVGEGSPCSVWRAARAAFRDYISEVGSPIKLGYLDVLYWSAIWAGKPWANTDTIHWPRTHSLGLMKHEFGHVIRHSADGSAAHFTNDAVKYQYVRGHERCAPNGSVQFGESRDSALSYGFNEGWGWYWARAIDGCGLVNEESEGEIAWALGQLQKNLGFSRNDMVQVLLANPGTIHNLQQFADAAAARKGVASSLLSIPPSPQSAVDIRTTEISQTVRARLVDSQITTLRARAQAIRRQAQLASVPPQAFDPMTPLATVPGKTGGCAALSCEAIFQAAVGPALAVGQARVFEAQARRLEVATLPTWPTHVQRIIETGEFDAWLASYQVAGQTETRQILIDSLNQAAGALAAERRRLGTAYGPYKAELEQARKRLDQRTGRGAPATPWLQMGALDGTVD